MNVGIPASGKIAYESRISSRNRRPSRTFRRKSFVRTFYTVLTCNLFRKFRVLLDLPSIYMSIYTFSRSFLISRVAGFSESPLLSERKFETFYQILGIAALPYIRYTSESRTVKYEVSFLRYRFRRESAMFEEEINSRIRI